MRPRFRLRPFPLSGDAGRLTGRRDLFQPIDLIEEEPMPHLLNVWPRVGLQLASADRVLLLLDYDGTLSPIAGRPDSAALPPNTRQALKAVRRQGSYTLGIVSGRGLADVAQMVGIPGLIYAGNHGLEIQGPGLDFVHPEAERLRPELDAILEALKSRLSGYTGVFIEGKGLTLSVHYRLTSEELRPRVHAGFDAVLAEVGKGDRVRITRGKEILEVRPNVAWDKGHAIARIAASFPPETLTVFFGDDLTDEDGFAAVHELNGISVFVGAAGQPTGALYRLDSPQEVAETLKLMARG